MHSTKLNALEDLELVAHYKQTNDNNFVGVLFQRYTHLIFGVCLKYLKNENDAQDASISVFEKLLSDLKKYEVHHFKSWLHSVCKTHCLMQLRSDISKQKQAKEMEKDLISFMETDSDLHLNNNQKELHLIFMEDCMK